MSPQLSAPSKPRVGDRVLCYEHGTLARSGVITSLTDVALHGRWTSGNTFSFERRWFREKVESNWYGLIREAA